LDDCVVRGEATFLRSETLQSVEMTWKNGLLATTEWLVSADGGAESPQSNEAIQVALERLVVLVGRGLCQLSQGEFAIYQIPARIRCTESILLGSSAATVIEQNGVADVAKARERIVWDGDRNFYEGFVVFWTISPLNASQPSEQMAFGAWLSHWSVDREIAPIVNHVIWSRLPAADQPVHTHTPADYVLDHTALENPALGAASDGGEAGFVISRLPRPAQAPLFETPPNATNPNGS
jgi:hypothetical protein